MSKSLLYLIKLSVIPIIALIAGKLIGVFLAGQFLGVSVVWSFSSPASFLTPSVPGADAVNVTTFANLFMYGCLAVGMSIILIQSSFFHDSHIDVNAVSKLANYNLVHLIKSSYQLYHWGFIWTVYLLLGNIVILIDAVTAKTDYWVLIVTGIFSFCSIMILVKDVYNEIDTAKKMSISKI